MRARAESGELLVVRAQFVPRPERNQPAESAHAYRQLRRVAQSGWEGDERLHPGQNGGGPRAAGYEGWQRRAYQLDADVSDRRDSSNRVAEQQRLRFRHQRTVAGTPRIEVVRGERLPSPAFAMLTRPLPGQGEVLKW